MESSKKKLKEKKKMTSKKRNILILIVTITLIITFVITAIVVLKNKEYQLFEENVKAYKVQYTNYIGNKIIESHGEKPLSSFFLGAENIKNALSSIRDQDKEKFEISQGKLVYIGTDKKEKEIVQKIMDEKSNSSSGKEE